MRSAVCHSEGMSVFCCVECRLLQPPTTQCVECAAGMTAPVELVRELLYYRDTKLLRGRDWSLITAFIAGSSIAMPVLAPVAIGSAIALGVHKLVLWRKKRAVAGVTLPPLTAAEGATTLYGVARKFRGTVSSLVGTGPVLVEHAAVKDKRGAVLLRRSESAPFLLEVEGAAPVLVTGVTRVTSASVPARIQVARGDERLGRMGVPADFAIAGNLEVASVAPDGPVLAVTGVLEDEAVAELAFHRDGGQARVMRGRAGSPVLVSDRRLIAAAL